MRSTLASSLVIVIVAAGLPAVPRVLGAEPQPADRPNVLVLHVDQLRIDCLGVYGNPDARTPNIDRLAADGVRYVNSFCAFPVCTPSRYSLLSGRYVHDHAGWSNYSTLAPQIATFPRIFRAAGYRTAAVGKMHFTPTYLDVGFDDLQLAEQNGPGRWDDDYHRHLMRLGLVDRNDLEDQVQEYRKQAPQAYWDTLGARVSNLPEAQHSTTWIADRAMEAVGSWEPQGQNLLMVGFIKPHHPFDPPAPWHAMYDPDKLTILPGWTAESLEADLKLSRGYFPNDRLTEASLRRAMAYYYATISQIDHHVGRLLGLLKDKGLYDKTLVVFTADHGEYLGFHHMLLKGNHMYDPLAKVPLLVKWPGNRRAGTVADRLVSNVDLAPTLCRAAGLQPAPEMRGEDLGSDGPAREIVFCESGQNLVMARTRTHKLILARGPRASSLFFDLEKDPLEMHSLYGSPQAAAEINRLTAAIAAWRPPQMPQSCLDLEAPQIKGPNVPPPGIGYRAAIMEYYRAKMDENDRPLRLAFITCCKDAAFFVPVKKGMQDAAAKMGVRCDWLGIEGVDMPAQAALVRKAVADGYDGIAVNLVDREAFDEVVAEALRKGVPVVGFNTDDHDTPNARLSCVNQRLYAAGQSLAAHVAPHVPEGSHILVTMHDRGVSSLEDRRRGLQDGLKEKHVRWTLLIPGNDAAKGAQVVAQALQQNPDIRIVLCTGQADTEAAGRAIERHFAGRGYWAAGFDLSPDTLRLLKAGHIRCTVDQQPYIQGFYPVIQLTLRLRYGIAPSDIDAGATIIEPADADRVLELTRQQYR